MINPTKTRLTLIFTSVLVVFNILILYVSFLFFHRSIINEVKLHMEEDISSEFLEQYNRSGLAPFKTLWDENHFQILNRQGVVVISNPNSSGFDPGLNRALLSAAFAGRRGYEMRDVKGEPLIVCYFPIDGHYVGRAARSLKAEGRYEKTFVRFVLLAFPGMFVLSFVISRYLVNHAMKPISDIFTFQETFSSNVTHELRSPLASIKGNFEVSLRRERSPDEYREVIRSGLKETNRIIDLLNNLSLLASSKFKPLDLFEKKADISRLVRELVAQYTPAMNARWIRFNLSGSAGMTCFCDEALIRRTIENLLDNAVKYTNEGGTISIALSRKGGRVVITISNTCEPMDRADLSHLFDPFYRGRKSVNFSEEGKGLGLYIARYIVRSHGGEIKINRTERNMFSLSVLLPSKV